MGSEGGEGGLGEKMASKRVGGIEKKWRKEVTRNILVIAEYIWSYYLNKNTNKKRNKRFLNQTWFDATLV